MFIDYNLNNVKISLLPPPPLAGGSFFSPFPPPPPPPPPSAQACTHTECTHAQ